MTQDSLTSGQLIRLAIDEANQEAVDRLLKQHRPRLVRLVMRWAQNHHDAEDICQVVLSNAHQAFGSFLTEEQSQSMTKSYLDDVDASLERRFTAWLDKIAFRRTIDFVRRERKHSTVQVDSIEEGCVLSGLSAQEAGEYQEASRLFAFAKKRLNRKQYTALYFFYVDGLSALEIAAKMNASPLSIRALLFRARRALKSAIRKHGYDYE